MSFVAIDTLFVRYIQADPRFAGGAIFLALLCIPLMAALVIDSRTYLGEAVWIKPLKFAVSLTVFLGTLAWSAQYIPAHIRTHSGFALYQWIVLACIAAEMLWISGAAMYATGSHFNTSTPMMMTLYGLMGLAAVTLTTAAAAYGALIWTHSAAPEAPMIGLSFIATFIATVIIAGYLAGQSGPLVGNEGPDATRLFFLGWSREVGDLRVPHFFATHIMQIVPLLWFTIAALRTPPVGTGLVLTLIITVLTFATFVQARQGQPFLPSLL